MGNMQRIRDAYRVPARRGGRLRFQLLSGEALDGTIVGATHDGTQYLRVKFDTIWIIQTLHPTWNVEYLPDPVADPDDHETPD